MICIECGEAAASLYTKYANGHIKLTDCNHCQKLCDKYVEFDNVLLFIDVLLLKPQAYKHLVFNLLATDEKPSKVYMLQRVRLLSVLFEIYLTWAYQEKKFQMMPTGLIYHEILSRNALSQYFFFGVKCVLDDVITHSLLRRFIFDFFQWQPKDTHTHHNVISLTIVISSGTKLFPILMLIWPYNDIKITGAITFISNLTIVEALRLVTGLPLWKSLGMFITLSVVKTFVTRTVLILMLTKGDLTTSHTLMVAEMAQLVHPLQTFWN